MFQHFEVTYCLHLQSNCTGLGTCWSEVVKKIYSPLCWMRQTATFFLGQYVQQNRYFLDHETSRKASDTNLYLNARLHHPTKKCSLLPTLPHRDKVICDQTSLQTTFYNNRQLKRHQAHSTIARADHTTGRIPQNRNFPSTHPKHLITH